MGTFTRVAINMSKKSFLDINEELVHRYCNPADDFTIENSVEKMSIPGCGVKKNMSALNNCAAPCFSDALLQEWDTFNKAHVGTKVTYHSREKNNTNTEKLTGWWLPADPQKGSAN